MQQNLHRQNRAAQPIQERIKEHEGYTVNARISARAGGLFNFLGRDGGAIRKGRLYEGGEGVFISFFKFRPQTNIVFILSKHEL